MSKELRNVPPSGLPENADRQMEPGVSAIVADTRKDVESICTERASVESDGETLQILETAPAHPTDDVPVIVVPGFVETGESFYGVMRGLSHAGRRVFALNTTHGIDTEPVGKHAMPQLRKAKALLAMMDAKGIEVADVMGHSEGAIVISIAMQMQPHRFRNTVLFNPAGIHPKENLVGFGIRYVIEQVRTLCHRALWAKGVDEKHRWKTGDAEVQRSITDSAYHSVREAAVIVDADINAQLRQLQKEHGKKFSIITTKNDLLFPLQRNLQRASRTTGIPAERITALPAGTHNAHIDEEETVVRAVHQALQQMSQPAGDK